MNGIICNEKLEDAIREWYLENDMPEPNWRRNKDPKWWTDYLNELRSNGEL
jgi:hypothetical protein